jgi:cell division protein FtsB
MITKKSKKKKSFQKIFTSFLFSSFAVAIVVLLVTSSFRMRERRKELVSQIEVLKKEIQNLEGKNQELKMGISQSQTQDYLEKEARESLGLKKPGEEVVAIKKIQSEEGANETRQEKNLWQKILEFFKIKQ